MPSWQDIINFFDGQWRVIRDAKTSFALALLLAGIIIWGLLSWRYAAQLENKDAVIGSRDATIKYQDAELTDYRSKLKGATPEEAAQQIERLRSELNEMQGKLSNLQQAQAGRRITPEEREKFLRVAKQYSGEPPYVEVVSDASCFDCQPYAQDFAELIEKVPGWRAKAGGRIFGPGYVSPGITVLVPDESNLSPRAAAFVQALHAANFNFNIVSGLGETPFTARLMTTRIEIRSDFVDQLPLARAPRSDVLDCAVTVQPLDGRSDLFANRRAQDRVSGIETFGGDHPARDVIRAQQLARCGSEHAKAEPRRAHSGRSSGCGDRCASA